MRKDLLFFSSVCFALAGAGSAFADDALVAVEADRIFTPTGFDDNDNAQVVVDGLLPSTCYSITDGNHHIDQQSRTIVIEARANVRDSACVDVLVPFSYEFNFGALAMGEWLIKTSDGRIEKKIVIEEASSSGPDNEIYASIDNAYVQNEGPHGNKIVLEGTYSNTCMVWDKTQLIHKDPLVIEILPLVRMEQRDDCEDRVFPFKGVKIDLPGVAEGRFLLHVRSMHGRAVNRVFTMGFAGPSGK